MGGSVGFVGRSLRTAGLSRARRRIDGFIDCRNSLIDRVAHSAGLAIRGDLGATAVIARACRGRAAVSATRRRIGNRSSGVSSNRAGHRIVGFIDGRDGLIDRVAHSVGLAVRRILTAAVLIVQVGRGLGAVFATCRRIGNRVGGIPSYRTATIHGTGDAVVLAVDSALTIARIRASCGLRRIRRNVIVVFVVRCRIRNRIGHVFGGFLKVVRGIGNAVALAVGRALPVAIADTTVATAIAKAVGIAIADGSIRQGIGHDLGNLRRHIRTDAVALAIDRALPVAIADTAIAAAGVATGLWIGARVGGCIVRGGLSIGGRPPWTGSGGRRVV